MLKDKQDNEWLDLCRQYTMKLLELQKVKTEGVGLFKPDEEKQTELYLINKSIEHLRRNKWKKI